MTKTLLLTGATGDIGQAIFAKFKEQQWHIIAPTRRELDLSDPAAIESYKEVIPAKIDCFIHCAGFNKPKPVEKLSMADVQQTMQTNTFSFFGLLEHLLPQFIQQRHGSIVAISSIYGSFSRRGRLAYAASKHALNGMVKSLALELGPHNIKVNGVAPGFVDTKMTRQNNSDEIIAGFKSKIPLRRLAATQDIAEVTYFLCSEQNNYINGQTIIVDGGYSVGGFQE